MWESWIPETRRSPWCNDTLHFGGLTKRYLIRIKFWEWSRKERPRGTWIQGQVSQPSRKVQTPQRSIVKLTMVSIIRQNLNV